MLHGYLRAKGYRVPIKRISSSYLRVHGTPAAFGSRQIERRVYSVPGVNSLWHHDGQHGKLIMCSLFPVLNMYLLGLIRWKLVTHAFIDGKSRLIMGIKVSNNNRATTVLGVFEAATSLHGWPSCVRGDHGPENMECAKRMEEVKGPGRGSYIWGR